MKSRRIIIRNREPPPISNTATRRGWIDRGATRRSTSRRHPGRKRESRPGITTRRPRGRSTRGRGITATNTVSRDYLCLRKILPRHVLFLHTTILPTMSRMFAKHESSIQAKLRIRLVVRFAISRSIARPIADFAIYIYAKFIQFFLDQSDARDLRWKLRSILTETPDNSME